MKYRSFATIISSGAIALGTLLGAPSLAAQARFTAVSSPLGLPSTSLLSALSQYRAIRWATSAPAIPCSPAPLTEPPGVAYRARPVAMEDR